MARPRKPTNLKVMQGTAQKCRLNPKEPKFTELVGDAPDHLSERAKTFWNSVKAMMASRGIVAVPDGFALESAAETYSEMVAARLALRKLGGPTYSCETESGATMYRAYPEVAIVSDCDRRLCAWYAKFGMTPADRSRVSGKDPKQKADPWDEITVKKA